MRYSKIVLSPVFLIAALAGVGEHGSDPNVTNPTRAWIASVLSYDTSRCIKACNECPPPGWEHEITLAPGGGDHSGRTHPCEDFHSGCNSKYHECGVKMARSDRDTLIRLIRMMPADELVAIDTAEPNLLVNWKRRAVQILGCSGTVVASLGWTPTQSVGFDALGYVAPN